MSSNWFHKYHINTSSTLHHGKSLSSMNLRYFSYSFLLWLVLSCLVFLLSRLDYPDFTQLKNRVSVCNKWDLQCQQNIRLTPLTIRLPHLSIFRLTTSDKNVMGDQSSRIFCELHLSGNVLGLFEGKFIEYSECSMTHTLRETSGGRKIGPLIFAHIR